MLRLKYVALSLVAAAVLSAASPAWAQHDATWKALGQKGPAHQGFSRRIQHAANYARDLHTYVHPPGKPAAAAVKEVVSELGSNLEAAKKHLATMKKEAGDDKATLAAIEKIEKRLTTAFAHHKEAHACCVENFDEAKALKCCGDLTKELDEIVKEHNALMKSLAPKKPAKGDK
jgi:hypothetical protein